jgi:hypothetical protein
MIMNMYARKTNKMPPDFIVFYCSSKTTKPMLMLEIQINPSKSKQQKRDESSEDLIYALWYRCHRLVTQRRSFQA